MIVLVDDLRSFRDGRDAVVLRTSAEALYFLRAHSGPIERLYLDHDLGGADSIRPVVRFLEERAFLGHPLDVGLVLVHSMNPVGAAAVVAGLRRYGYSVRRVTPEELISGTISGAAVPSGSPPGSGLRGGE